MREDRGETSCNKWLNLDSNQGCCNYKQLKPLGHRTIFAHFERTRISCVSIVLTGAIEARSDGVQKGVLWGQEALHHRHLDPDVGRPTAGWRSHHPRGTTGGFQGLSAGAGGDFEGDSPVPVVGTHIYSTSGHPSQSDASPRDNSAVWED